MMNISGETLSSILLSVGVLIMFGCGVIIINHPDMSSDAFAVICMICTFAGGLVLFSGSIVDDDGEEL